MWFHSHTHAPHCTFSPTSYFPEASFSPTHPPPRPHAGSCSCCVFKTATAMPCQWDSTHTFLPAFPSHSPFSPFCDVCWVSKGVIEISHLGLSTKQLFFLGPLTSHESLCRVMANAGEASLGSSDHKPTATLVYGYNYWYLEGSLMNHMSVEVLFRDCNIPNHRTRQM